MANLEGKTVLVTASGQGIGRASALGFLAAGAKVYATDISEALLAELPASDRLTTGRLDVLDDVSVASFIADIGPVDVLFN
jgi:2-keto-3-deoxy-L-fuconate dehydrogenase